MLNNTIPIKENLPVGENDPHYSNELKEEKEEKSSTNLVKQHLEKFSSKAAKSEKEIYEKSFSIFATINDHVRNCSTKPIFVTEKYQISEQVSKYIDLVHNNKTISRYAAAWDLAYILYFTSGLDANLVLDLSDWINEYDPLPGQQQSIWETAYRNLLRGNFDQTITSLQSLVDTLEKDGQAAILDIIAHIEKYNMFLYNEKVEYEREWKQWHDKVVESISIFRKMIERNDYSESQVNYKEIMLIYDLILGKKDAIATCGTFFERVIGTVLLARPNITIPSLNLLAQSLANRQSDQWSTDTAVSAYILMGCFDDAFEVCEDDLWLQTHLGHALIAVGVKTNSEELDTFRESKDQEAIVDPIYYCVYQYAHFIAKEHDMWNEAIAYLTCCRQNKEIWIKALLGSPPLESKDMKHLKAALTVTERYKLDDIQKYIHRAIGQRHEQKKEIVEAIIEYGKASDIDALNRLAQDEFNQYMETGKLGKVVTDMEELNISPYYAVLILYQKLRTHLEKKEHKQASQNVIQLLQAEELPAKCKVIFIMDSLDILEDKGQYFNAKEATMLINIFKAITKKSTYDDFIHLYYKFIRHVDLPSPVIVAKLRERIAYKAAIAATQ